MTTRADVVRVARSYIGTPWAHMSRRPGIEIDCGGMIVCIMRELGLSAPDWDVELYTQNPDGRSLIAMCDKHLIKITRDEMQAGDVVCVVMDKHPQHLGIVADYQHGGLSIIHASNSYSTRPPRVIETRLMFSRVFRFVAAYRMDGVT